MIKRPKTAVVGLKVRLREPLRKELEVAAKRRGVSLNSELVSRLEKSFAGEAVEQTLGPKVELALQKLEELLLLQREPPEHWSEEAKAFHKSMEPARRQFLEEAEQQREDERKRMIERNEEYMRAKYGDKK